MADELTIEVRVQLAIAGITKLRYPPKDVSGEKSVDVTGTIYNYNVQTITSGGAIPLDIGPVTNGGYFYLENVEAAGGDGIDVDLGGKKFMKLEPGEPAIFRTGAEWTGNVTLESDGAGTSELLVIAIDA